MTDSSICGQRSILRNSRKKRRRSNDQGRRGTYLLYFLMYILICEEIQDVLASKDLYATLGVSRDADLGMIKKAYRKLAVKYHPDKNPGDKTAAKMYVELNNAYEVLSDKGKRHTYDMTGSVEGSGDDGGDDPWDPWGMFTGQRRRHQRQEEKRVPDLVIPMSVDLELLYNGGIIDITHRRQVLCTSWSDCEKTCTRCGGQGIVIQTRRLGPGFVQQIQTTCPECGGSGKIGVANCTSCPNGQFEKEENPLTLNILKGVPDGHRINEGQTDELPDHLPGDVYFQLHTKPHARFYRDGHDLHYNLDITLQEALTGVNRTVQQLDGRDVAIQTDHIIAPNDHIRIDGEGMPILEGDDDAHGDMLVKFWVQFPKQLSEEQKKLADEMLAPNTVQYSIDGEKQEL